MTDFSKQLKDRAALIEDEFDKAVLSKSNSYKIIGDAMLYSLKIGGKRIRPIILLEFYKLCGGKEKGVMNFAAALEMIHTYSLIHDDLPCMDNDDFRRGKPSCHKAFGENIAVLAGDGLLTEAFAYAARAEIQDKNSVTDALSKLAEYAGINGMIGGQVIDITSEDTEISPEKLNEMYSLKTAALIVSAAEIGCILAGCKEKAVYAGAYAENIGLAFQIVDDILDLCSDSETLGKPVHSDEKNKKQTYAFIHGIEESKKRVADLTKTAISALSNFEGDTEFLRELALYLVDRKY